MRASVMHGMKKGFMEKAKLNVIGETRMCTERVVQIGLGPNRAWEIDDSQTEEAA